VPAVPRPLLVLVLFAVPTSMVGPLSSWRVRHCSLGLLLGVLPSMLADVVDFDELEGGRRREGAFASILSYVLKFGTTMTLLITGPLIELTGFDVRKAVQDPTTITGLRILFASVPATAVLLAALALRRYPLTRDAMNTIRASLEARRGAV